MNTVLCLNAVTFSSPWWIRLLGGVFLCYLGIGAFLATPAREAPATGSRGLRLHFATTFVLTITNPMTILSFLAVFAGLGLASMAGAYREGAMLVAGVFLGSALWWFLLSGAASFFRDR